MRSIAVLLLALAAALHLHAQTTELDRAKGELHDAEDAYFEHQLHYPTCDNGADLREFMQAAATKLGLTDYRASEVSGADIPATPYRLERLQIAGSGEWLDVMSLVHRVALFRIGRIGDVESLQLTAAKDGNVAFEGTLAAACHDPSSKALDVALSTTGSVDDRVLAAYRDRAKKLRDTTAQLDGIEARMQPMRFFDAIVLLADAWSERGVRVSELHYTVPALTLRGLTLTATGKAAVESALRKPGYDATRIDWSASGDCQAFTASARLNASAPERGEALPKTLFASEPCAAIPAKAGASVAKRGTGPITLHLRNVDISSVFHALNDLSPNDGFVLDPGMSGRVDVAFDSVTTAEALAALRSAGIAYATPGPLHRVCARECSAPAAKKGNGEPITFVLAEADVVDVLRVLQQLSGLNIRAPRDLQGALSIYVTDTPWDTVFESIFDAVHQKYTIDGDTLYVGDRATAVPVEQIAGTPAPSSFRILDPRTLMADDLRLAGIGGANGTWTGFTRVPGSPKMLFVLSPKSTFADGTVTAVSADRVTLRTSAGRDVVLKFE